MIMTINEQLNEIIENDCDCGRSHKIALPQIIVEKGAIGQSP